MYKTSLVSGALLITCAISGWALPDSPAPVPTPAPGMPAAQPVATPAQPAAKYTANELDLLFKPVALYPDPLLAQMLPAASHPAQIEAANQFLKADPKGNVDGQPWDASVKALAHYPEVVEQMAQDLAWTEALGQAAAVQMGDVTASIQRLRTQAYAAGNLQSNEQQTVNTDESYITIQPTSPQVLYVPVYNPYLVYAPRPYGWTGSLISFGLGYACGSWLNYGFDWYGNSCFRYPYGNYYGSYWGNPGCNQVSYIHNTYNLNNANCWRPTYGNYNNYNTCYRPGNSWSRVPGCNYSNGGNWTSSNFYRPGGNWSNHVGNGWNSPGSHPPRNWNSGGNWNSGYRPGGNWSTPGNSRYTSGWANGNNSGWSNHHSSNGSGWNGNGNNGWNGNRNSGWANGNNNNGWNGNRGSSWTSGNSGWNGNRGSSWTSGNNNGWSGNRGSSWTTGNNSGWSGNRGSSWTSGNNGWSGGNRGGWSGGNGGGFKMPSAGSWSGGGRRSGGFSMPSSGGWSGGNRGGWSGGNRGGFSMPSSGGWSGGNRGGWSGGNRGGWGGRGGK